MNSDDVVVIDIMARFQDRTKAGLDKTKSSVDKLGDSLKKTKEQMDKINRSKAAVTLEAIDRATQTISKVTSGIKGFAGRTFKFTVGILDTATKPLRSIFNFATSIQGILTGILAGKAIQGTVVNPIGLADSYTSASIGFETLFGSQEKAQKMMDDLDQFAKETPFKTAGVIANAQKMIGMGWNPEDIIGDMRIIGDAAAATGKGDEGFDSIVRALSQIKTKGKLSTEELNQLAEAGIRAKAYLAEGLGYGSSDAGMAQLSSDLEKGLIGSEKAIELLMQGMQEYNGMMDKTANETVEGLKSQLEDTFEISILRKWGQGLQTGVIKGLKTFNDFLGENQDKLDDLGDTLMGVAEDLSGAFADAVQDITEKILDITESDRFKNATIGGKVKILWDEIIGDPFSKWWDTKAPEIASEIADVLGNAIKQAVSGIFSGSHLNIFGGGEKSILNDIAAGYLLKQGFDFVAPMAKGGFSLAKKFAGVGLPAGSALSDVMGSTLASGAGWLSAAAGLFSAGLDFSKGMNTVNDKERRDSYNKAGTKAGMVALGTAIGTVIAPGIGTAIGAGLGGLGAMTVGGSLGQWVSDMSDGTEQIRDASSDLAEARKSFEDAAFKDASIGPLLDEYEALQDKMSHANMTSDERAATQEKINGLVRDLAAFYPELIGQYDIENGRISANLDTLREISALEKERSRWQLEKEAKDARETYEKEDIGEKLQESNEKLESDKAMAQKAMDAQGEFSVLAAEIEKARLNMDALTQADFEELTQKANDLANKFGYNYQSPFQFAQEFGEELDEVAGKYIDSISKEQARNDELTASITELYEAEKALIENKAGLNASLEETAGMFDTLDEAQKDAFMDALEQVEKLQSELGLLPESVTTEINVIRNEVTKKSVISAGAVGAGLGIDKHANGGILTQPHMGLVAEAGPEAIIPLSGSRRNRGIDLWEKAGALLGVRAYANGGIAGDTQQSYIPDNPVTYSSDSSSVTPVNINLGGMNFSFSGSDLRNEESVVNAFRNQMPKIANELCELVAKMLGRTYESMSSAQV